MLLRLREPSGSATCGSGNTIFNGIYQKTQPQADLVLPYTTCARMRALLRIHTYTVAITLSSLFSVTLLFYTLRSGGLGTSVQGHSFFQNPDEKKIKHLEHVVQTLRNKLSEAQAYEHELLTKIDELQEQVNSDPGSTHQVHGLEARDNNGWDALGPGVAIADQRHLQQQQLQQQQHQIYSCRHTDTIKISRTIGQGHTKMVQEGMLLGKKVAVKSASLQVKSVQDCLKDGIYKKKEDCLILATYKVLKEAMILRQVRHPNIVRLVGLCVRSEKSSPNIKERGVTLAVELGTPVHLHELMELPWRERLKLCSDLGNLLQFLADSPMGSTAISDFRDEQFVLVDGTLKLADVDDLSSTEPDCDENLQCLIEGKFAVKCSSNMKCLGLNAQLNLLRAYEVFIGPLLSRNVPPSLEPSAARLLKSLKRGDLDAEALVYRLRTLQTDA